MLVISLNCEIKNSQIHFYILFRKSFWNPSELFICGDASRIDTADKAFIDFRKTFILTRVFKPHFHF